MLLQISSPACLKARGAFIGFSAPTGAADVSWQDRFTESILKAEDASNRKHLPSIGSMYIIIFQYLEVLVDSPNSLGGSRLATAVRVGE